MKLPGWLVIFCSVSVVVVLLGAIFIFSGINNNYEAALDLEPSFIVDRDFTGSGTVGYVVVKSGSIYFIHEKELHDKYGEDIQSIKWDELSKSNFMGHPTDAVLFGKPVDAIEAELKTGDKVEIWYREILESYPGKIKVEKIQKL